MILFANRRDSTERLWANLRSQGLQLLFLLMAAGYAAREAGILERGDVFRFNRAAFRIFLPCLLFMNIYESDLHAAANPGLILFAVAGVLLVFFASCVGVKYLEPLEKCKSR